jgi:outer membrane receptor protein involved in Fe transport
MKRAFSILLVFLTTATFAPAQSFRGTIVGTVKDGTGAVLPGVEITATNAGTAAERKVVSGETGEYSVPLLPPGTYTVSAALPGFKTNIRSGITLLVDQTARIDFTLGIGDVSEKVEVMGDAPLINTESSTVGTVIANSQVVELPLNGRQFLQLNLLVPGATTPVQGSQNSTQGGSFVVNGAREQDNNFLIDGIDNNDLAINIQTVSLSIDAIQEFKLQSSTYTAEFGRSGGGQINLTTKSGTNDLHGSLFEFLRNDMFDARNFFASGQPKPKYRQNQFGFSLGGPIKRNSTFFFINTDITKIRQGVTQTAHVPSLLERTGDFTASNTTIFDPQTYDSVSNTRQPFSGNKIPSNRINPVSKNILDLFMPLPNLPNPTSNFISSPTAPRDIDQWTIKIDQKLPHNDDFFARFTLNDDARYNAFEPFSIFASVPKFGTNTINRQEHGGAGWIHIFSPTVINEFRTGFNRFNAGIYQDQYKSMENRDAAVGIQGYIAAPFSYGLARMTLNGFTNLGDRGWQNRWDTTYDISDVISYTRGNHRFKGGFSLRPFLKNRDLQDIRESMTFSATYSTDPRNPGTTGSTMADFLLGYPTQSSIPVLFPDSNARLYQRTVNSSYYFQDDWKMSSTLTLNFGLRYELNTAITEKFNHDANFNPATGSVIVATPQQRNLYDTDLHDFAPRFGFAWAPSAVERTSVRGGYGIFFSTKLENQTQGLAQNPPFVLTKNFISSNTIPQITIDSPYSGAQTPAAPSYNYFDPKNYPDGYMQQWGLSIGHELVPNLVIDIGYVGSKGTKLDNGRNMNQAQLGSGSIASRRPYPTIATITQFMGAGNSSYNSFQFKVEKRLSGGLSFLSSYTWSKSIDYASKWGSSGLNAYNLRLERGLSDFDVRHRWSFSHNYELPFGSGRHFLSNPSTWEQVVLGGWQLSGILSLQTGNPMTAILSTDRANIGTTNQRPDQIADPNFHGAGAPARWFDTAAFALPAAGTFGNAGRNTIQGPPVKNMDIGLMKRFALNEKQYFQFRAEAFDLTNHTNFDNPNLTFGGATFGRIQSANIYHNRQIQFALKYYF